MNFGYVVEFEACALLFLIIVTFRFYFIRKFPSKLNTLFSIILHCSMTDILLDLICSYTVTNPLSIPLSLNYLMNTIFYAMQVSVCLLMLLYVLTMCGVVKVKYSWIWFIPSTICAVLLAINPFTHSIFYFEAVEKTYSFEHGGLFGLLYFTSFLYMFLTVCIVTKFRRRLKRAEKTAIIIFITIVFSSIIIQIFLPDVLLTGVGLSMSILIMFFAMQNPEDMLDRVSGVFNHGALYEYLRIQIHEKHRMWLTAVEIGGIRRINSSFGLRAGNQILNDAGNFFNKTCKGNAMTFQMVGTKFLIVSDNQDVHNDIIACVSERFQHPWKYNDIDIRLIATIRYSETESNFSTPDDITNLIDLAYANAAGDGYGTTKPIGSDLVLQSKRKTQVEDALRRALESGIGFSLNYQPIYSVVSGNYHSAEALLRLNDSELGNISPAEFIPIAESTGLIKKIDTIVFDMACTFLKSHPELIKAGFKLLEINLSAAEFHYSTDDIVDNILKKSDSIEKMICFEVTETVATTNRDILAAFMNKLIKKGFIFAIDDFGTGFANITQLAKLPFSIAKIDRSLIISEQSKERLILEDVVKMFSHIGLETVIEGVETDKQAAFAINLGVDEIQGYYYSLPLTEPEFVTFILKQGKL